MNTQGTNEHSVTVGLPKFKAMARDLRQRRPSLPHDAQPHASNLIEQLDGIETAEDADRLAPFVRISAMKLDAVLRLKIPAMKLLQEAGR